MLDGEKTMIATIRASMGSMLRRYGPNAKVRAVLVGAPLILSFAAGCIYSALLGERLRYPDEMEYVTIAYNLVHIHLYSLDGVHVTAFRSPGYPLFIAFFLAFGSPLVLVRIANFAALSIAGFLLSKILARFSFPVAALVSPYLVVFYPVLFYTAGTLYPQTLAMALLLASLYLLVEKEHSALYFALSGAVFGILILVVPSFLFKLPIFVLAALILKRRKMIAMPAIVTGTAMLVISICTVVNYVNFNTFIPVSTNTGANFLIGNSENTTPNAGPNADISRYTSLADGMNEVERDRFYQQQAIKWIVNHKEKAVKLYTLKTLNYFNYRNDLHTASEGSQSKDLLMLLTYGTMLLILCIRLALAKLVPLSRLETFFILMYTLNAFADAIVFTRIRYRLPYDGFLIGVVAICGERLYHGARRGNVVKRRREQTDKREKAIR